MARTFDLDRTDTGPDAAPVAWYRPPDGRFAEERVELGRGGIGRVMVALDRSLDREVAVKRLLDEGGGSLDTSPRAARFVREARIAARLEHPGIVPIYDAGVDEHGEPFYVMRRIRGRTLAEALAGCRTLAERLRLLPHLVDLAHTVAYAHSRGVLHRDLKPSNTMIGDFGETVVLDWGSARSIDDRSLEPPSATPRSAAETAMGSIVGTPAYMSPEQARGEVDRIDARSDVYAIGVVLFELLAGRLPYEDADPITLLALVGRGAQVPVPTAERAPRELVAIAEKAMRPRREERYAGAGDIARDLEAWQNGERVQAYAYSTWELVGKLISRHRQATALAAFAAVAVPIALVAWTRSVDAERQRAVAAEAASRAHLADALAALAAQAEARRDHHEARLYHAEVLRHREDPRARGYLVAFPAIAQVRLEPVEQGRGCVTVAWSADSRHVACGAFGEVRVFSRDEAAPVRVIGGRDGVPQLAFAGDDGLVVREASGRTERFDPPGGERRWSVTLAGPPGLAANGSRVALFAGAAGEERVVELDAADAGRLGDVAFDAARRRPRCLALREDGALGIGTVAGVFVREPGGEVWTIERLLPSSACAFAPDGWLAIGTSIGAVHRVEAGTSRQLLPAVIGMGGIVDVSVLGSGQIALHTERGATQVFGSTGTLLGSTGGAGGHARFSPDGDRAASTAGGELRLWDATEGPATTVVEPDAKNLDPLDGSVVRAWRRVGRPPVELRGRETVERPELEKILASPTVVVFRQGGEVRVRDLLSGVEHPAVAPPEAAISIDADPATGSLAAVLGEGTLWTGPDRPTVPIGDGQSLVRVVGGTVLVFPPAGEPFAPGAEPVRLAHPWTGCVLPTPDRQRLLVGHAGGVDLYEAADLVPGASPLPVRTMAGPQCATVAVSADGALAAIAPADAQVAIHDLGTGALLAVLPWLTGDVDPMAFARDGSALLAEDTSVRRMPLAPLRAPVEELIAVARAEAGAWIDGSTLRVGRPPGAVSSPAAR